MIDLHSCVPCFKFFYLGLSTIFLGGGVKWEWGLTLNPMEKFEHHILNSYTQKSLKILTWHLQMHILSVMGNM